MDITYNIRETPSSPQSAVVFQYVLRMTQVSKNGNDAAWSVDTIECIRYAGGVIDAEWYEDNPVVDTSDGLWWVAHDDVDNPVEEEFTAPPLISGVAQNRPAGPELTYSMEGQPYGGSPQYGGRVSALTHSATVMGETEPEEEGEDEPVEVEPEGGN